MENFIRMYNRSVGYFLIAFLSILQFNDSFGQTSQTDTFLNLKEIEIIDSRLLEFSCGTKINCISKNDMVVFNHESLTGLMMKKVPVYIKTYGIGSLATPSFRGTSANHTAVVWNGINMQSNMNGQYDLSLSPINLVDDIQIQLGGAGALYGSGAVGGTIHLNNKPYFNQKWRLGLLNSFGSFQNVFEGLNISYSNQKSYTSLKAILNLAQNDFEYRNIAKFGQPLEKLTNANFINKSILLDQYLLIKSNQQLEVHIWLQDNLKYLPPTMTMSKNTAFQKDQNLRATGAYKFFGQKWKHTLRLAYFNENIHYIDSILGIDANNNSETFVSEYESRLKISSNHLFNFGVNNSLRKAIVDDYSVKPFQNNISLFLSYKYSTTNKKLNLVANLRDELFELKLQPLTPSLGVEYYLKKQFLLFGNISKTYRLPTFNDLYWNPGGNPDLKPESGWSNDLGVNFFKDNKKYQYNFKLNLFSNLVDDWIIWLPESGAIWTPKNIRKVWSKGFEADAGVDFSIEKAKVGIYTNYSFTSSSVQSTSINDNALVGKQLIYVPKNMLNSGINITLKDYWAIVSYNLVGKRYVQSDNSVSIPWYHTMDISFGRNISIKKISSEMIVKVNNIWNEEYQSIQWRPMPYRNYMFCLNFYFNQVINQ